MHSPAKQGGWGGDCGGRGGNGGNGDIGGGAGGDGGTRGAGRACTGGGAHPAMTAPKEAHVAGHTSATVTMDTSGGAHEKPAKEANC